VLARLILFLLIIVGILSGVYTQIHDQRINTQVLAAQVDRNEELRSLFDLKNFWEKIIISSPTYRDGYLQLAIIYYQLGNADEASKYLSKVYELDPNYELPVTLSFLRSVAPNPQ
jgi:tetratricopeptide (TPR) repeat protein